MVLKKNAAGGVGGEILAVFEFRLLKSFVPFVATDGDIDHQLTVEVVLEVFAAGHDLGAQV